VLTPAKGPALAVSELNDPEVRDRFGAFGSRFVKLERLRRETMQYEKKVVESENRARGRDHPVRSDDPRRHARFFDVRYGL
jgi:hypothetical protein